MNIKKIQGKIPMHFKKIIPLSLAAMSVMGAFTACSDNKVVGADEQPSTVAVKLPLDATSAEKSAALMAKMNEVSRPNRATAVFLTSAFAGVQGEQYVLTYDTVNARQTYEDAMQTLINNDVIDTSYLNGNGWICSKTEDGTCGSFYHKFGDVYTMQDENGVLYGEISVDETAFSRRDFLKSIYCLSEGVDDYFKISAESQSVGMDLKTKDSVMTVQFMQDCIAENGFVHKSGAKGVWIYRCTISRTWEEDDNHVKNPYWKKYAAHVVDNCRSDLGYGESYPNVPCISESCSEISMDEFLEMMQSLHEEMIRRDPNLNNRNEEDQD